MCNNNNQFFFKPNCDICNSERREQGNVNVEHETIVKSGNGNLTGNGEGKGGFRISATFVLLVVSVGFCHLLHQVSQYKLSICGLENYAIWFYAGHVV